MMFTAKRATLSSTIAVSGSNFVVLVPQIGQHVGRLGEIVLGQPILTQRHRTRGHTTAE